MTRGVGGAISTALIGALFGAAWLAFFYALHPAVEIGFDTDPPRLVSGAYPAERDEASGLTFAWTGSDLALRFPGLDRSVDWTLTVRVRGARADASQNPSLSFYADGVLLDTRRTATAFETMTVTIPARLTQRRGTLISLQPSATFVPGPGDTRALGVMIDHITLSPIGIVLPSRQAFAGASIASAAMGAAIALVGVTPASAIGAVILVSAGEASLIARGFAPHTDYPMTVARTALWTGTVLALVSMVVQRQRRVPLRNTARFAAAFSAGALLLKLLLLLHPDMPVGDAMFHAHKFQGVIAGNLYFTSIAPGGYLFPYPPGLYVFALPFAALVERGAADMTILRIVVLAVDACAGLLLYWMVVRMWENGVAAAIAVALYQLIPLDLGIVTTGNLTNAFAQSISVFALALFVAPWVRWERRLAMPLLAVVLTAAFLSHTGTFPILLTTALLVAALFWWKGGAPLGSPAGAVLAAAAVALVASVALYYAHFGSTYRTEFARIGAEAASAAPDAGGRGIGARLGSVPMYLRLYLGPGALLLAAVGAWDLYRRGARDRLTLAAAAWGASCLVFLAIGILTPVDMRYYLASIPAVAIAGAAGAATAWSRGGLPRVAAAGLLGWVAVGGIVAWHSTF